MEVFKEGLFIGFKLKSKVLLFKTSESILLILEGDFLVTTTSSNMLVGVTPPSWYLITPPFLNSLTFLFASIHSLEPNSYLSLSLRSLFRIKK